MTHAGCFYSPETDGVPGEDQRALSSCPAEPELLDAGHLQRSPMCLRFTILLLKVLLLIQNLIFAKLLIG